MWILVDDQSGQLLSLTRVQPNTEAPAGKTWTGPHEDIDLGSYTWNPATRRFVPVPVRNEARIRTSLEGQADAALARNKTFIDTPNAQLTNAQVVNHLKDLTRQVNALIRLSQDRLLVPNDDT